MTPLVDVILILLAGLAVLVLVLWAGLQVRPRPFPSSPNALAAPETVPLPPGLPAPVERFYKKLYGDRIPVMSTVVLTGRGRFRPAGPAAFPGRFRFLHLAGKGYRHYIEITWFGIPLMRVNERYVNGQSRMAVPFFPVVVNDPKTNRSANLALWAEAIWFPSLFLTDPRARWEPVDDATALLRVPFEAGEECFVVRFDPQTAMVTYFEAMRYKAPESASKTLWISAAVDWTTLDGMPTLRTGAVTWMDDGKPWAVFTLEDLAVNVDLAGRLETTGL